MNIQKNKDYRVKGNSPYFKKKYGTSNPVIRIEDKDAVVFGGSWEHQNGNPACLIFAMRAGTDSIRTGDVWYGKIDGLGELVDSSELEEQ